MSLSLIAHEQSRLEHCETVIRRGLDTFYEVGNALAEIRDTRLYREKFGTFADYCRERWGMAARTAHQTIQSAGVVRRLGDCEVLPVCESVARALVGVDADEAKRVWLEAIAVSRNVTAQHLKRLLARSGHAKQIIPQAVCTSCPKCGHEFRPHRPETASRGCRRRSRGVAWACTLLPDTVQSVCDYGCGRFRNAGVLEERFASVVYADTRAQCERVESLRGNRTTMAVGGMAWAGDAVFVIAVLHILRDHEQRQDVANQISSLDAPWLVIETPRSQPYYRKRMVGDHYESKEGTHYWHLTDAQVDALFPCYTLHRRSRIKHNETRIYARNCAQP